MRLFWLRFLGVGLLLSGLAGCPQPPVEICNNDIDDDGDALADCDDSDCAQVQDCLVEVCDNSVDDNGDGLTDCQDPACLAQPVCDVPPAAQDDAFSTEEDTALTLSADQLLANDADGNGDTLTVSAVANAVNGSVALNGADITFTPDADFFGSASFEYTIDDGNGNTDSALVTVTVNAVNDAPVATDDTFSALEDTPLTLSAAALLANDLDVEGDTLTITAVANAQNGAVALNGADVLFTPDANFSGAASFEYTVEDGNGGSDTALVTINVDDLNAAPEATDDAFSTDEDTNLVVNASELLANDVDSDGDTLTLSAVANAQNGSVALAGGNVIFTPDADFSGTASFEYTVIDGVASDTGLVTVTVNPINDAPVAEDQALTTQEDTPLNLSLTALDVDGDTLSFTVQAGPANGTLSGTAPNLVYTPNANFTGTDSFTFIANDGALDSNTATVSITVDAVNDAPIAADDNASVDEDSSVVIPVATLLANDTDVDGDTLSIVSVQNAQNGTAILNGADITFTPNADFNGSTSFEYTVSDGVAADTGLVTVTVNPINDAPVAADDSASTDEDTPVVIPAATLLANDDDVDGDTLTITTVQNGVNGTASLSGTDITFTPDANFNGAASFEYTIDDGNGGSDTAVVNVTVAPIQDAPVAADDSASTNEDTPVIIPAATLLANDFDADGDTLTVSAVQNGVNGTATLSGTDITFTPDANFNGDASFEYTVDDGNGNSDTATVTVNVGAVNNAPVAADDAVTTDEDTPVVIPAADLLANDFDADGDTLSIVSVQNEVSGSAVLSGTDITFTPDANFNGAASFEYTVSDGNGGSDTALVTVTVNAVNDAPVANDISATTNEDTAVGITLTASDVENDTLSFTVQTNPVNGVLSGTAPNLTYTPNANFTGTDSFTFIANDGALDSNTATVTITVNAVNDAPIAVNDAFSTDEDTDLVLTAADLLANDSDVENDALSVVAVFSPLNGTVSQTGDTITFTPNANFFGEARFSYSVSDGVLVNSADVIITVNPVNDAPVANADTVTTDEDVAVVIPVADLLANDTDVDGDTLLVVEAINPVDGAVVFDDIAGTITFTPDADFNGDASFTYAITDGVDSSSAVVTVTVAPQNDIPVATDDTATTDEDLAVTTDVLANDQGLGDGGIVVTITAQPANGAATVNADNSVTYTPNADANGADSYTYQVADADGDTDTALVNVTVNAVNDAPVADDISVTTDENIPVDITLTASDVDGDTLSFNVEAGPTNGVLSGTAPDLTYTPNANFAGADSFTFTANDGQASSNTATVSITVNAVAVCGNGLLETGEECDDNNNDDGDGCEADCLFTCASGAGADRVAVDGVSGNCYAGFDGAALTFDAAQTFCADLGGYLVTVTSAEENTLARSVSLLSENPWLGGDDRTFEGTFEWVTGEDFALFQNFASGEPDNDAGVGSLGDCLFYTSGNDQWGDTNCDIDVFVTGVICEFEQNSCGDNILQTAIGEECDDGDVLPGDGCDENCLIEVATAPLFFSEYIEGSSSNKAIEIFNPSTTTIDLAGAACSINLYSNGAATPSRTTDLGGPILPGGTLVLCNGAAAQEILDVCNTIDNGTIAFNGNDAVELVCGGVTVDVIGQIGDATAFGQDVTLRRKCGITSGDVNGADIFDPALEWDGLPQDTFDGLGAHDPVCP